MKYKNMITDSLESSKDVLSAMFSIAKNLHDGGFMEEALSIIEEIIKENPNHHESLKLSSLIRKENTEIKLACEILDKAIHNKTLDFFTKIFPSYNYFSNNKNLAWVISPERKPLKEINLEINEIGYIDIQDIELLPISSNVKQNNNIAAEASSSLLDLKIENNKISNIHTQKEKEPWLNIRIKKPQVFNRIILKNRKDGFSFRAKNLKVNLIYEDGSTVTYPIKIKETLKNDLLTIIKNEKIIISNTPPLLMRELIIKRISESLSDGKRPLNTYDWRRILKTISFYEKESFIKEETIIIAAYLLYRNTFELDQSLYFISNIFNSEKGLIELENLYNSLAEDYGYPKGIFTRHGISPLGEIHRNKIEYLNFMDDIFKTLREMKLKPLLAYGSLLGAVRDSSFIPHDDDIDILCLLSATCIEELMIEREILITRLKERNFDIEVVPNCMNFHIKRKSEDLRLDIFPSWESEGEVYLHMEKMNIRPINYSILYPESEVILYQRKYPSPNNSAAFLRERYGESWSISDRFFEWPWLLTEEK